MDHAPAEWHVPERLVGLAVEDERCSKIGYAEDAAIDRRIPSSLVKVAWCNHQYRSRCIKVACPAKSRTDRHARALPGPLFLASDGSFTFNQCGGGDATALARVLLVRLYGIAA